MKGWSKKNNDESGPQTGISTDLQVV